jgi:uncharacterized membrane-anchored protein
MVPDCVPQQVAASRGRHPAMDHPLRASLANELHARPFLRIAGPAAVTHYAIYADGDATIHDELLGSLCELTGLPQPDRDAAHYSGRWGPERQLKWERHTEFSTFTFVACRRDDDYFSELATQHVPQAWFWALEGKVFVAVRIELVSGDAAPMAREDAGLWVDRASMVGSQVLGDAQVFCDWTIRPDGFLRFLVIDNGLRQVQSGRLVQRLYEIETYRMMALLALPVARDLSRSLEALLRSLAPLMLSMDASRSRSHDAALLARLTHLAARTESLADAGSRMSAARAYEGLVHARIHELGETRLEGMPTIAEFLERRFGPAMATCKTVWARHEQVAARIARAVDLLRTRVSVAQEEDTTRLLEGIDRSARSQLRLQHAVEGLSIAAISYYVLSLSGAALRSLHAANFLASPEAIEGILILPVVLSILFIMRRKRRIIGEPHEAESGRRGGLAEDK